MIIHAKLNTKNKFKDKKNVSLFDKSTNARSEHVNVFNSFETPYALTHEKIY